MSVQACCMLAVKLQTQKKESKIRKTGLRIPDVCTKDIKKTRIINNVLISLETAAKRGRIRVLYSLHVIRNTPSDSLQ